jgi:HlyD family secretion protein
LPADSSTVKRAAILVVVFGLAAGAGAWLVFGLKLQEFFSGATDVSTSGGTSGADSAQRRVVALGRIEPAGGVVNVGALPGDRLGPWNVQLGQTVPKATALVDLASRKLREHERQSARSQLAAAEMRLKAELRAARAQRRVATLAKEHADQENPPALKAQTLKIEAVEKKLALAESDYKHADELPADLVSAQEKQRFWLLVQSARAELEAAKAELDQLKRSIQIKKDAATADLEVAQSSIDRITSSIPIDSMKLNVQLAELQYEQTQILAPIGGTILKMVAHPGELTGTMPILQMANLDEMVVVAEVYQADVKQVEPGDRATIRSPSFKKPYFDPDDAGEGTGIAGTVVQIGQLVATADMQRLDPSAPADRRTVEVRIAVDPQYREQAAALINLQVDVTISQRAPNGS